MAPRTLKDWAQALFFALLGASIRFDPLAATGSSRKPKTGLKSPTRHPLLSQSRRALLAFRLLDEAARAVVAEAVLVTVARRGRLVLVAVQVPKANAASPRWFG
jgi:hypothetical protein